MQLVPVTCNQKSVFLKKFQENLASLKEPESRLQKKTNKKTNERN